MNKNVKSLRRYLFDQLERLANADKDNIDTEVKKATSMIQVSEEILTTANTEIELLKAVQGLGNSTDFIEYEQDENIALLEEESEPEPEFKNEFEEHKESEECYPGTFIRKKKIKEGENGKLLTEEKRTTRYR